MPKMFIVTKESQKSAVQTNLYDVQFVVLNFLESIPLKDIKKSMRKNVLNVHSGTLRNVKELFIELMI